MIRRHAPAMAGLLAATLASLPAAADLPSAVEQDGFRLTQVGEGLGKDLGHQE